MPQSHITAADLMAAERLSWADLAESIEDDIDFTFARPPEPVEQAIAENPHLTPDQRDLALRDISAHHP